MRGSFLARFWAKVEKEGIHECWVWKGTQWNGYGVFNIDGRRGKAHRLAFELFHRRKPKGNILHRCENKLCVNPHHLYEGNYVDNARDLYAKGGGQRKLSDKEVGDIRRLYKTGHYLQRELAEKFGCTQVNICHILTGQKYVHVT